MPLRLYDTLTKQVKEIQPIEEGHLRFYACGPTVYSFAHIGNFRTFLAFDLVCRTAAAIGWKVSFVSNITDVGHLTADDAESGEDRMERGLKSKEGARFVNVWDLADFYADSFKHDWARLNLRKPLVWPKATQHMREQILAVEKLIENGHAYSTPTGAYFRVSSFANYGELSGNKDRDQLYTAVRDVVVDENKEDPRDFALWKKDEKHLMQWFSPWGWGFPGWHIECSVMAMEYLGETIDLHAGGEDLIFPHHECEIAQSESLTGKPFSKHWMHTKHLLVNGEKMSKSLGNFFTVREIVEEKGADPLALRYALIAQNYRVPHNFTLDLLRDAASKIDRYRLCDQTVIDAIKANRPGEDAIGASLDELYKEMLEAMCEDLNTSVALAKALEGTRVILRESDSLSAASAQSAKEFLDKTNALLGIVRHEEEAVQTLAAAAVALEEVDEVLIQAKINERLEAKKAKDFSRADAIRQELASMGIELRDTPDGTDWKKKGAIL